MTDRPEHAGESRPLTLREGHALDLIVDAPALDLIVTDPPYAFGGAGGEHAVTATVATALRESAHKLKRGHWAIVFAASSWRSTSYMIEAVHGILEPVRTATWVKPASKTKVKTAGWAWASVSVLLMRKGPKNAVGAPSEMLDWILAEPLMVGRRAQLPPAVAEWAVNPFLVPGGVMLDPFTGSGALCKAAADGGMQALGFEIAPPSDGLWTPQSKIEGSTSHCARCKAVDHATAHPTLGCADVGCTMPHTESDPASEPLDARAVYFGGDAR